jgi:hypothetical protein
MDMPVEAFTVPGNMVPFIYWKLGCTAAAEWDEAASKGGNILEHLPKNRRPYFAPDPELAILTGMDAMSSASSLFLDGQSGEESVSSLPATSRIHPDGFHGRTPISERESDARIGQQIIRIIMIELAKLFNPRSDLSGNRPASAQFSRIAYNVTMRRHLMVQK